MLARQHSRKISESGEDLCPVCSEVITIFAVGSCDHVICYSCSTRMRALCKHMYCAICRTDNPQVYFSKKLKKFSDCDLRKSLSFREHQIFFEDAACEEACKKLLEHRCTICNEFGPVKKFMALKTHVQKVHRLFYCDICVEHLKIFCHERKTYDRQDLARHRRIGDANDTSHKGHPLCEFCEERFLDNDELLRHLRKEHYYCHLCDTGGSHQYYNDYDYLLDHFKSNHYVCEEDDCASVQFTNVFRTDIDLKAHRAQIHKGNKQRSKQERTLDLQFEFTPRTKTTRRGQISNDDYEDVGRGDMRRRQREEEQMRRALAESQRQSEPDLQNEDDFPIIDGATSRADQPSTFSVTLAQKFASGAGHNTGQSSVDDYPALPTSSASSDPPAVPKYTKPKNHTKSSWQFDTIEEDFPALSGAPSQVRSNPMGLGTYSRPPEPRREEPRPQSPRINKEPNKQDKRPRYDPRKDPGLDEEPSASQSQNGKVSLSSIGDMINSKVTLVKERAPSPVIAKVDVPSMNEQDFPSLADTAPAFDNWLIEKSKEVEKNLFVKKETVKEKPRRKEKTIETRDEFPGLSVEGKEEFPSLGGAVNVKPATWVKKTSSPHPSRGRGKQVTPAPEIPPSSLTLQANPSPSNCDDKKVSPTTTVHNGLDHSPVNESKTNTDNTDQDGFVTVKIKSKGKNVQTDDSDKKKKKKKTKTSMNNETVVESKVEDVDENVNLVANYLDEVGLNNDVENDAQSDAFEKPKKSKKKKKGKNKENENNVDVQSGSQQQLKLNIPTNPSEVEAPKLLVKTKNDKSESSVQEVAKPDVKLTYQLAPPETSSAPVDSSEFPALPSKAPMISKTSEKVVVITKPVVAVPPHNHSSQRQADPVAFTSDDFPSLDTAPPLIQKPPASSSAPPPGFSSQGPPGLSLSDIMACVTDATVAPPGFNDDSAPPEYSIPERFTDRNHKLIQTIRQILGLDENRFNRFKLISGDFRQSNISASQYYSQCRDLLGEKGFGRIFSELLILLPDIPKQNELYSAHLRAVSRSGLTGSQGEELRGCPSCRQIVKESEYRMHSREHGLMGMPTV